MEKMRQTKRNPNCYDKLVEMRSGDLYAINTLKYKWYKDKSRYEKIGGEEVYLSGHVFEGSYKSDQFGNPIENVDGKIPFYTLEEIQQAETVDEDGEPSDYAIIGYNVIPQ